MNPEIDSSIYGNLIVDKGRISIWWGKNRNFLLNRIRTTGYLPREQCWISVHKNKSQAHKFFLKSPKAIKKKISHISLY